MSAELTDADLPSHPDPHAWTWTDAEKRAILRWGQELFAHAAPTDECPYCHACWPECLHCDGTGLAAPAAAVPESPADPLRVACVTLDGSTLTVPVAQLGDVLHGEDDQHTYTLTLKTMTRAEFDALGEFNGF